MADEKAEDLQKAMGRSGAMTQNENGEWVEAESLKLPWWDRLLWRIFGKRWVAFIEWWDFR